MISIYLGQRVAKVKVEEVSSEDISLLAAAVLYDIEERSRIIETRKHWGGNFIACGFHNCKREPRSHRSPWRFKVICNG